MRKAEGARNREGSEAERASEAQQKACASDASAPLGAIAASRILCVAGRLLWRVPGVFGRMYRDNTAMH